MTFNDNDVSFFFNCSITGISGLDDDPKEYSMFKDHHTQGVTTFEGAISILNSVVAKKMDLWNVEVKKWTEQELLKSSELAQATLN